VARTDILGVRGNTYAERKVKLLKQLGYKVDKTIFEGLTDLEIDRKARDIILPPREE
jgi:hypothetical protein